MENIIFGILSVTLGMSVIVLLITFLFRIIGKKFTVTCKYIIWAIVIIRLAVPVSFNAIPSLFRIPVNVENIVTAINDSEPVGNVGNSNTVDRPHINNDTISTDTSVSLLPSDTIGPSVEYNSSQITWKNILYAVTVVYLAGVSGSILFNSVSYLIYARKLVSSASEPDGYITDIYMKICREKKLHRMPKLLCSDRIKSPLAFGIFRRRIFIPAIPLDSNSIKSTLEHEVIHCKRGDLYIKALILVARALHWFNPLVHIAAYKCETAMELSCDETLLMGYGEEERLAYGETMLDIVRSCRRSGGALTTHFNPKKSAIKARLSNIISGAGKSRGRVMISVCLLLSIFAGTLFACNINESKHNNDVDSVIFSKEANPSTDFRYTEIENGIRISLYVGNDTDVVIPDKIDEKPVVKIDRYAFQSGKITSVYIPDSVISIEAGAFINCDQLSEVYFGRGITSIAKSAFRSCYSLEKIILPEGLQSLGDNAFADCSSVKEIFIPKTLTEWGYWCFLGNVSLEKITFEEGLTQIGGEISQFVGATSLKTITIPASVTAVGESAFGGCNALSDVYFEGDAPELSGDPFWKSDNTVKLTIHHKKDAKGWDTVSLKKYTLAVY